MNKEVIYTDSFATTATHRILGTITNTLSRSDYCCISLCGGSTPYPVYEQLAEQGNAIPWDRVIITFGDERCVPPDHKDSNYRAAKIALLDRLQIPKNNILRIKGEESPEVAALKYEAQLDAVASRMKVKHFKHDLILLGMGNDGHTASLFPGTDALEIGDRRVVSNYVPKLNSHRITFTFSFINQSETVMFLVNDAAKRQVLEDVLAGRGNYPAARVAPANGTLIWVLGGLN